MEMKFNALFKIGFLVLLLASCSPRNGSISPVSPTYIEKTEANTPYITITNEVEHPFQTLTPTTQKELKMTATIPDILPTQTVTPNNPQKPYVGLSIPPFPNELKQKGAGIIDSIENFALYFMLYGDKNYMILFTEKDTVIDVLNLPTLNPDNAIETNTCFLNGNQDQEIIAVSINDQEVLRTRFVPNNKIRYAWRANRIKRIIEPISITGIECSAEGGFDPNNITNQH
jgi:hypothetical protein